MRDELRRILEKVGWTDEDVEDLKVIFSGKMVDYLDDVEPDILETALKELVRGGNVLKRIELASKMTNIPPVYLIEVLHVLNPRRYPFPSEDIVRLAESEELERVLSRRSHSKHERRVDFPEILKELENLHPMDLEDDRLEDAEIAYDLSRSFREALRVSNVHPYIVSVIESRRRVPLLIDGSNLLWKAELDPGVLDEVFEVLPFEDETFYPVSFVFDSNVEFVVPAENRKRLKWWLSKKRVYTHSPADELLISLSRQTGAWIMSSDRFREYDTTGLKILPFPKGLSR